ncbi:MAG: Hin recombinase [Paucibacter sp.]|nr:Hin recombinase [Roseateles sp.]
MARPSKLSPEQWADVERRSAEGETARALAREFDIDEAAIRRRVNPQTPQIKAVAHKLVEAREALAALPVSQQYMALNIADRWRNISNSYTLAAELATKTGHRLHALANAEVCRVDDSGPLSEGSIKTLRSVGVLTKMGNDALVPASNLLAANKAAVEKANADDGMVGISATDRTARIAQIMAAAQRRKEAADDDADHS